MEVIWKVFTFIMNNLLHSAITLDDALHGFRKGWGTRTDALAENLAQKIAGICHGPLFQVFLDMREAYDYLYQTTCMEVLKCYGLGPKLRRLLKRFW